MQTIGILGGMSAASTQMYYSKLCELVREKKGGLHSPELLIRSLDFAEIETLQAAQKWGEAGRVLNQNAKALESGGADFILLATNTMHKVADEMMEGVGIPLLHIADATADAIFSQGLKCPGLIATTFTMEQSFYTDNLRAANLAPIIPKAKDRERIHKIIYDELCREVVRESSRAAFVEFAGRLVGDGADCVILGCTEVGLLLNSENVSVPVFDTTHIHCEAAMRLSLGD